MVACVAPTPDLPYSRELDLSTVGSASGRMCHPEGGTGRTTDPADLLKAEEHLEAALKLAEPDGTAHAQVRLARSPSPGLLLHTAPPA